MSAYRDPSGQWRYRCTVRLKDGNTERISGTPSAANTKLAAQEAERAHRERTVNPPAVMAPKKAVPSFSEFATSWLAAYPASAENRSSTIKEKEFHVRVHLVPHWGDTPIDRIDSMGVAKMIGDLKKKPKLVRAKRGVRSIEGGARSIEGGASGTIHPKNATGATRASEKTISAKTVKNVTQTLHRILATAHEWKILTEVPKFPKRKKIDAPWDWYTAAESARLLGVRTPERAEDLEDSTLVRFALRTGARAGEQLAVTWADIDWENHKVSFRRQYHKGEFRQLKAGPSRSVDLAPDLIAALKIWRAKQIRPMGLGAETDGRDLIFPKDLVGRPMETWHLRDTLRRVARRAGLRVIKWHELRHSFASQLVTAGVPLKQVQEWLGHSTIQMTMRYAHLAPTSGAGFISVLSREAAT